jgi:N-methylhydantoinase A/oxoprolinase/acetone carboxylase beta subunit
MLDRAIESMKPSSEPMPVVLVGGGAILVTGNLQAASVLHRPENADVANAIGAAIAQIGAEVERLVSYRSVSREDALRELKTEATDRAVTAGADKESIRVVDIEETSIPYMDEAATRIRVKVVGDIAPTEALEQAAG